ncbi:MAG: 2OG-Fe(II) oxygenase [Alphaproteobacteria bacterium]|nr:2OG-Fe(II) oxygenase [Alphaproteobacteria bacterium]
MTLPIDVEAVRNATLVAEPFPYLMVPGFVRSEAIADIERDFPPVAHPGSFPLPTLQYGPAFQAFMDAIRGPEFSAAVADKFGINLSHRPTMVTVRGQSSARDGQIHTDSTTKLITVLIYMNGRWESPKGRLRLLRSATDLNAVVAEVPPDEGTLVIFKNQPNAWHGFEPFEGPRKVIQLNWVTNARVVWWEQTRHKISAFFKGKHEAPARM